MKKNIILIIIIMLLCGCSKNENELNVLNWSSYIPDDVIHDFEKEYNIKVNYSTYSSNEELLAKVTSTKLGTYDLIFPSDYMIKVMINKELLQKIDKSKLNNYKNIDERYMNKEYDYGNNYSLPFLAASIVITYNNDKINNITSFNDLLNEQLKNNIVVVDDERIIVGVSLMATGHNINDMSEQALNDSYEWLNKIKNNIKIFDSDSPKTFLMTEEVAAGIIWNAEAAIANKNNSNIVSLYPTEGIIMSIDNYAIMKNAKNMDNAYLFIDYLLRGNVMSKIIDNYPYCNINTDSIKYLDNDYLSNNIVNISTNDINRSSLIKNIGEDILKVDKLWINIK